MTTRDLAPEDAELIAAFIDRRLSEKERRAFMGRLDTEEALYEVFVETVRYRDQGSDEPGEVVEHPSARGPLGRFAAIAALLVFAVATPILIRSLSEKSYAEMLVSDGQLDGYLEAGWYDPLWSTMRGGSLGTSEAKTAFRVGVRVVDLEVALRVGKLEDGQALAGEIERLLEGIEMSDPLRLQYGEIRRQLKEGLEPEQALRLAESVEAVLPDLFAGFVPAYELGRWTEAGKLAAQSGSTKVLRSRSFAASLKELERHDWSQDVVVSLSRLTELLSRPDGNLNRRALVDAFLSILETD